MTDSKWNKFIAVVRLWFLPIVFSVVWISLFIFVALPGDFIHLFLDKSTNGGTNGGVVGNFFIRKNDGTPKIYFILLITLIIDIGLFCLVLGKNIQFKMSNGNHIFILIICIMSTPVAIMFQETISYKLDKAEANMNDGTSVTESTYSKIKRQNINKLENMNDIVTTLAFTLCILLAVMMKAISFVRWDNCKKINDHNYNINYSYNHEEKKEKQGDNYKK